MSNLLEKESFIKGIPPFDRLSDSIIETIGKNLDIEYFSQNSVVVSKGDPADFFYLIIKGLIQERDDNEVFSLYSNGEFFDPISLIENHTKHNFVAIQESICYILPREFFIDILHKNSEFEQYLFQSISQKLTLAQTNEKNQELTNFMVARVKDAYLKRPILVDSTLSIYESTKILKTKKASTLLVRQDDKIGIVTDSDFRNKLILKKLSFDEPVVRLATFNLQTILEDDFLFNAQLNMTKHGIKRLIVKNDSGDIVGILDQISLVSFFASHTYAISYQIQKASNINELKSASQKLIRIVKTLFAKGVKVRYISKLIHELNIKIYSKLFDLLAPKELLNSSSLIVMGSEGRSEQVLKSDQDNALIISDECNLKKDQIEKFGLEFTNTLIELGYPKCPGNIMISNPKWVLTLSDFKRLIVDWIDKKDNDSLMNLAIFYDSKSVAGSSKLLKSLQLFLNDSLEDSPAFFAHFAKSALNFPTPLGIFTDFIIKKSKHKDELDIKKGGIFAIVHGVRALSLEYKLNQTNTIERLKELNNIEMLDRELTTDLIESLTFLFTIRLKTNLDKLQNGEEISNYINIKKLSKLEKDLLKDSFKTIDSFKKFLTFHYKLDILR
jgi:CBS domain-containing protein